MPRITIDLETIQLIDGIKEKSESKTQFLHRCIEKMLRENYNIHRKVKSNGRNQHGKRY